MSALGLAMARRDAEIHPAILDGLLGLMANRGRDGRDVAGARGGALGHLHFWTTPEEVGERQPIPIRGGRAWLAFDGRIDDREALWRAMPEFPGPSRSLGTTSDAALVAAAYAIWGLDAFSRLLGPFAIAIWDAEERRAILARDPLGGRGLAVVLETHRLLAASEAGALAAVLGRETELDFARVASYFSLEDSDPRRTFCPCVRQMLPGEILVVEAQRERWIRLPPPLAVSPELVAADPEERARELGRRLDLAIRCRLRSVGRPAVLLSGGLDSSPIAALARRALPEREDLCAISWVFPRHPRADESRHLAVLERELGLELHALPCDDELPLGDLASWPLHPATPEQNAYRRFHERAYEAAAALDCGVLLSGMCGDQLYGGAEFRLREAFGAGRIRAAVRAVVALAGGGALRPALGALFPDRLRLERSARRAAERFPWLTERALELLPDPVERDGWASGYRRPAQARSLLSAMNGHGLAVERHYGDRRGVDLRYPLRDRRVLELFLSLPADDLGMPEEPRPILKRAMRSLLPASILARTDKATFEEIFRAGVYRDPSGSLAAILLSKNAAWREFLRPDWIENGWKDRSLGLSGLLVWLALSFELWLRRPLGAFEPADWGRAFDSREQLRRAGR